MEVTVDIPDEKESLNQQFLEPKNEINQIIQNPDNQNHITDQYFIGPELDIPKKIIIPCKNCSCWSELFILLLPMLNLACVIVLGILRFLIPLAIISTIIIILILCICYHKAKRKVEIERDENKNVISIKRFNYFGCVNKQFELSHFYFYIGKYNNGWVDLYRLFMIKDFENSSEIDLDTSNIKNIPIKIYDYLDYILPNKTNDVLVKELNDLAGVSQNHKCAFKFNIREYMKIKPTKKNFFTVIVYDIGEISKYMKFCENYFTYYITGLNTYKKEDILRIDFIYSRNFDRIFIGLVNNNGNTYRNTFEFQMNSIDKFILQKISFEDKGYNFKVNLKNNKSQQIYSFQKATQEELRGLVYLANEKLTSFNNNNQTDIITEENPPSTPNIDS